MQVNFPRFFQHLLYTDWQVRRHFSAPALSAIETAIAASETLHSGEIRFAIEGNLAAAAVWQGQTARDRAIDVFSQLRIWDTEHNNGVLIYVLLADHAVEIVADRGIHARVGDAGWNDICQQMQQAFANGQFTQGAEHGIQAITALLQQHFPANGAHNPNELPNAAVVLNT